MVFVFYTFLLLLMFMGIGLADYFNYPPLTPFAIVVAIAFLHATFLFISRVFRVRNSSTNVYVISNSGQQPTSTPEKTVSPSTSDLSKIPGMTEGMFRQLAKVLLEMEWISNRAISEKAGISRDKSAVPKTSDVIEFLVRNDYVVRIGNGRYKLSDRGKFFLSDI